MRHRGEFDQAEAKVRKGLSRFPADASLVQELAEISLDREDWFEAVKRLQQVVHLLAGAVPIRVYCRMSRALRGTGAFDTADSIVRQAISTHGTQLILQQELAEIAMSRQDWAEAVKRWQVALDSAGVGAPMAIYARMSQALRNQNEYQRAEAILRAGLARFPADLNLVRESAELAMSREDWTEALRLWQILFELCGDSAPASAFIGRSTALRARGDFKGAAAIVQQGLSVHSENLKLWRERSLVNQAATPHQTSRGSPQRCQPSSRVDSVIRPKLRTNRRFVQACAFGMHFSHAEAQQELEWANECRASWVNSGEEEWCGLGEEGRSDFIKRLLEEVIANVVASLEQRPLTMGVSAGYDSRILLHFFRRGGVTPEVFTFGQVGDQDFDFVSLLNERQRLGVRVFDTSEIEWRLEVLDQYASYTRDFPLSPRVPVGAILDQCAPGRYELNGHLGDSLTGIQQSLHQTWDEALRVFCKISNRFNFQQLFPSEQLIALLPKEPLIDSLSFPHQLDLGYLECQRMRPVDGPNVKYILPFRDPRWVGFWLNRLPEETYGQSLWLRFLHSLGAEEFIELNGTRCATRKAALRQTTRFLYASKTEQKIDLTTINKAVPSEGTMHFCVFACHANNPHFRRMVDDSVKRLKGRDIFENAFIDDIVCRFISREPGTDRMLNGLVSLDVMAEAGIFD